MNSPTDSGCLSRLAALILLLAPTGSALADIDLAGQWEMQPIAGDAWEAAERPDDKGPWTAIEFPGPSWDRDRKSHRSLPEFEAGQGVWLRRAFTAEADQIARDAVFRWEVIRWGFEARINGESVGDTLLYAPGVLPIRAGLLRAGANELLLKLRSLQALPRAGAKKRPTVPVGSGIFWAPTMPGGIDGEIGIDLFDGARLASVVCVPDPERETALFRVEIDPARRASGAATLRIAVGDARGQEAGAGAREIVLAPDARGPFEVAVGIPRPQLWSPETPTLYSAEVRLVDGAGRALDGRSIRFGMRRFEARDGGFYLNGRPISLRGSNLVHEWLSSEDLFYDRGGQLKNLLVDRARGMNVGVFRTHTLPPNHRVADLCDREGMLLFAEMPMTYNYNETGFDAEATETYRARGKAMCLSWVRELANHPSIILWVPTNEPTKGDAFDLYGWEHASLIPAIKALDPGRPVLRSGEDSPDILDSHCYAGFWGGAEGEFYQQVERFAGLRDGKRPIMNSEYLELFPPDRRKLWSGSEESTPASDLVYATFGMEQTEALRRSGYDGILPYMFSAWARRGDWRPGLPTPMYAALRNALAPVTVSLDLFDRHFVAGSSAEADVVLMNDLGTTVAARLTCFVSDENPCFLPEGDWLGRAREVFSLRAELGPRSRVAHRVRFPLPEGEATRYLVARLEPANGAPSISQREIRTINPAASSPRGLADRTLRVIGADADARAWLGERGIRFEAEMPCSKLPPETALVVVWENAARAPLVDFGAEWIRRYVLDGGRLLMLRQPGGWDLGAAGHFPHFAPDRPLVYRAVRDAASSAFRCPAEGDHAIWDGVRPEYLLRWNGLPGAVAREAIEADFLPEIAPVLQSGAGSVPAREGCVGVEGENPASTNFRAEVFDEAFMEKSEGREVPRTFEALSGGRASLLSARRMPEGGFFATYDMEMVRPFDGDLWVFEQGRRWSAPFAWRIGEGPWVEAPTTLPMQKRQPMGDSTATFAWARLGAVRLPAGKHRLAIRVDTPKGNGHFFLAQDRFLFAPRPPGEVLCQSGAGHALLVRVKVGKGEVLVSQFEFSGRLRRADRHYDPAAERLLLNLLAY